MSSWEWFSSHETCPVAGQALNFTLCYQGDRRNLTSPNSCCRNMGRCQVWTHACNPCSWEVEAGGFQVQGHSGLHTEILPKSKEQRLRARRRFLSRNATGVWRSHFPEFITVQSLGASGSPSSESDGSCHPLPHLGGSTGLCQ